MKPMFRLMATSLLCGSVAMSAQTAKLTVDTSTAVATVSPTLYGLMTEEINYSYDGGLYAEMVQNRSFKRSWQGYESWTVIARGTAQAKIERGATGPSSALPKSMMLKIDPSAGPYEAGIANSGYWGMAVRPSSTYSGSFYAMATGVGSARARLISDVTGATLAEAMIPLSDGDWQKHTYTMKTSASVKPGKENHLEITFEHPGTVCLQLVSLMPPTFHDRPNGNRPDLMEMMAAMKPHFLRLPGGNYLEGDTIRERFNWKETIGPLVDRPTHRGPWNYQSSDGMGLLEFLEWCEDLKIEPVLAVYAGYSLHGESVVGKELEPFIQDALDEIEYVTGDASTKWGAVRVQDGHPVPFPLHYIEIGNEDTFDKSGSYEERFARFSKSIRSKYPQYKLIATTPVKESVPDVVDDHYYLTPDGFFEILHKYDTMDRKGPKIFVGEWATRTGTPTPDFGAALGDAAWMTSMERNSDLIVMASYAPLFTNVNPGGMQWSTDLIGYDALRAYGSPSYYAQVLFGSHLGDHTVKSDASGVNARFSWSATVSTEDRVLHLKLVNASDAAQPLVLDLRGAKSGSAALYSLHAATRWATNSIEHPDAIKPIVSKVSVTPGNWNRAVAANTIEVIDIPLQ
ncbi:alpha-L-arabinofuranosidase domain protein [Terriglobus saanensis SP1PR4]|uniref:non-reducing end alpha-L-arabinofuranosidase n=2 Tax=Terriglobus saanensis TaxID=870903 RepID=E8V424_TERSS|nr:alpha-L-arabinofuranosidase domain protein [Terriglobus saanensis SP1PR4]